VRRALADPPRRGAGPARRTAAAALAAALLVAASPAVAQAPPESAPSPPAPAPAPAELVTDRPDQTESAAVVAPGFVQLETGVDAAVEGGDPRAETTAFGSTLVRAGVVEGLELRLGWGGWERTEEGGAADEGAADAELGLKVRLWEARGARPQAALLAGVSLPVGERGRSSERHDPALRLAFAHDLPAGAALGYNLGLAWSSEPGDAGAETSARLEYTATLGFGLSERVGAFVELFGDAPVDAPAGAAGPAHAADAGLTLLVTPRLQLDLAAGAGLSAEAPDRFLTAGVSIRWPR
jgi:hypothetical protein